MLIMFLCGHINVKRWGLSLYSKPRKSVSYKPVSYTHLKDTVYLDFEGNEGDIWEEEVQNLVFSDNEEKS